jgi:hypothetical protein
MAILSGRSAVAVVRLGGTVRGSTIIGEFDVPGHLTIGDFLLDDLLIGDAPIGGLVLVGDGN